MATQYITSSSVARSVPFDNTTNGFTSTNTQSAIEEVLTRLSVPITDQSYYVSKNGNDTTGNGSISAPYLTIGKALTTITDSSPTKRYDIFVGPGDYNENLSLKANVFIKGSGPLTSRLTGTTLNINEATWNVDADNRSGFLDMAVNPTCTWDFSAQTNNNQGKLYFWNVRTSGAWTATALNPINQIIIQDSQVFGAMTFNGCNTHISATAFQGVACTVNSGSSTAGNAILSLIAGSTTGNVTATWTSNGTVTLNLDQWFFSPTSTLTASGSSCTVNSSSSSLPVIANRTQSSSAIINRVNVQDQGIFGDGSDGDVSLSSGTTTLTRTMYYNNLTLSSTAILNPAGYKIYVRNTLTMSGTSAISNDGTAGGAASGNTPGTAGAGAPGVEVGAGASGTIGVTQTNSSSSPATIIGYGASGGAGGNGGTAGGGGGNGTGAAGGVVTYVPERVLRHDHWASPILFKSGGNGGAGGAGGGNSLLAVAAAGGGGGGGGGTIIIFAAKINNTSSTGITAKGGNGGAGGTAVSGNSGGGGGGGAGGGGMIYIITITQTALGTLTVTGGTGGALGAKIGTGTNGTAGANGSTGHTSVLNMINDAWTVT